MQSQIMFGIIILFSTLQVLTLGSSVCEKPPSLENGIITCDEEPLTLGKVCHFTCNEGYELKGVDKKFCLHGGLWSGPSTTCIAEDGFRCQLPPPLEHGTVVGCASTKLPRVSERCSFRCNEGYVIKGPTSVTCRSNGMFTDDNGEENFPKCEAGPKHDVCANHTCQQICRNENGEPKCRCGRGYILNQQDQRTCKRHTGPPIHPRITCQGNNGGCDQVCTPTQRGVICSCEKGYTRSPKNFRKCIKIAENTGTYASNPCQENNGGCHHYCSLSQKREVFCSCWAGYERDANDGTKCILKRPPAAPQPQLPATSATCESYNGGCQQICASNDGVIQCSCQQGYVLHSDGKHCVDVNECSSQHMNNCQHYCSNTKGSYKCSCKPGFVLTDGYRCEDVNECSSEYMNNCQHICTNTEGSYTCSCKPGFVLMDGHKCEGCGENSYWSFEENGCIQCPKYSHTDSEGKTSIYDCKCNSGFISHPGNGIACADVDECQTNNFGCSDICVNIPGSAYCTCLTGFQLDKDNKTCIDVDECSIKNGGCEGLCQNLYGSFRCNCLPGYVPSNKDQYSCDDVDECLENNGGCEQICINHRGGYYCACENGYRLDRGLKNCTEFQCPALPLPPDSYMICKKKGETFEKMQDYPHGTICTVYCKKGFKHSSDSRTMKCQKNGTWAGTLPTCRALACDPVNVPENGAVHPSTCSTQGNAVRQKCTFTCNPGYKLQGYPVLRCRQDLQWNYEVPVCQSVNIQPRIDCPQDVTSTLEPGKSTFNITLKAPITNVENYIVEPEWVFPGISTEFPAGVTKVSFIATSPVSNKTSKCVVTVTVLDKEPPVFEYCPDSIQIEGAGAEGVLVAWEKPVVTDNVQVESIFSLSEPNTTFAPGTYVVEYIARDIFGNIASCSFDITIIRVNCSNLADPPHGTANCMDWTFGKFCQPQCEDGYIRKPDDPPYYSCDDSGIWEPSNVISECLKFVPATFSTCPDGFMLEINEENEEICVECPLNTELSATTQKCEETAR